MPTDVIAALVSTEQASTNFLEKWLEPSPLSSGLRELVSGHG